MEQNEGVCNQLSICSSHKPERRYRLVPGDKCKVEGSDSDYYSYAPTVTVCGCESSHSPFARVQLIREKQSQHKAMVEATAEVDASSAVEQYLASLY